MAVFLVVICITICLACTVAPRSTRAMIARSMADSRPELSRRDLLQSTAAVIMVGMATSAGSANAAGAMGEPEAVPVLCDEGRW